MTSELVGNNDWETFPGLSCVGSDDGPVPDRKEAALLLFQLGTIRHFEQWLVDHEDLVHGPVHSSVPQEAVAVGAVAGPKDEDAITSTHRTHHHVLAKGMACTTDEHFDPVEVLDLRTLDRSSLDAALIVESSKRTGALVIVEDAPVSHCIGAQIADQLQSDPFGVLRSSITRVTGKDVPAPVSKVLEDSVLLKDEEITAQLRNMAREIPDG